MGDAEPAPTGSGDDDATDSGTGESTASDEEPESATSRGGDEPSPRSAGEYRVVCIGVGGLGGVGAGVLADLDGVAVVAGADVDPEARETFATEHGVPTYEDDAAMLADVDADGASIATPHTLHHEQAAACLDRGLDVHLEKPMVTDVDDAHDLLRRAAAGGLTLAVGYQRHLDPRFQEMRRVVDDGRIGGVHAAVGHLEQDWLSGTADTWRVDPDLAGGGQLYDSGSHLVDALLWVTRSRPAAVAALADHRDHDVDVDTAIAATLQRAPDAPTLPGSGPITASLGVTGDGHSTPAPGESLRVFGTDGTVAFDGETLTVVEGGTVSRAALPEPEFETLLRRKLSNWVGAARGEEDLAIPASAGLRVTAFVEAALTSVETGERVDASRHLDRN